MFAPAEFTVEVVVLVLLVQEVNKIKGNKYVNLFTAIPHRVYFFTLAKQFAYGKMFRLRTKKKYSFADLKSSAGFGRKTTSCVMHLEGLREERIMQPSMTRVTSNCFGLQPTQGSIHQTQG
ncbi:hypothetical protein ATY75_13315 [Rhizobium sp. N122]|nr:hypothetical protein ATY75_13315 [Rhizobium sp. N122]